MKKQSNKCKGIYEWSSFFILVYGDFDEFCNKRACLFVSVTIRSVILFVKSQRIVSGDFQYVNFSSQVSWIEISLCTSLCPCVVSAVVYWVELVGGGAETGWSEGVLVLPKRGCCGSSMASSSSSSSPLSKKSDSPDHSYNDRVTNIDSHIIFNLLFQSMRLKFYLLRLIVLA